MQGGVSMTRMRMVQLQTDDRSRKPMRSLPSSGRREREQAEAILRAVCAEFGITRAEMMSKQRMCGRARAIAIALVREELRLSFPMLGRLFGRHHTSVLAAYRMVVHGLSWDRELANEITAVQRRYQRDQA